MVYSAIHILIGLMLLGCTSTKKIQKKTIPFSAEQNTTEAQISNGKTVTSLNNFGFDDHKFISLKEQETEV